MAKNRMVEMKINVWVGEEKETAEDKMVDGITDSMDVSLSKLLKMVKDREAWFATVHGFTDCHNWATEKQQTGPELDYEHAP